MNSLYVLTMLIVIGLWLSGCQHNDELLPTPLPTKFQISGRINGMNGSPLAGITVVMDTLSVTTNNNGFYTFSSLSNGEYEITPNSGQYSFTPKSVSITIDGHNEDDNNFLADEILAANMRFIKGGPFIMGSIHTGTLEEYPIHIASVSSFIIGKYEVTQKEWKQLMAGNPSSFVGDSLPVERVTWYDAVAYCNALSKSEGLDTAYAINGDSTVCDFRANGYRLPTEAEWEFACRSGSTSDFFIGDQTETSQGNYDDTKLDQVAWYSANSDGRTHPVGQKLPNNFGLFDTHGNVFEWCWDWRGTYSSEPQTNPTGPSGPDANKLRICRGGSWFYVPYQSRSAFRLAYAPGSRFSGVGFRVARTVR